MKYLKTLARITAASSFPSVARANDDLVVRAGWSMTYLKVGNKSWGSTEGGNQMYTSQNEVMTGVRGTSYGPCDSGINHAKFYIIAGVSIQVMSRVDDELIWKGGDWGNAGSQAAKEFGCGTSSEQFEFTGIGEGWSFEVAPPQFHSFIGRFIPAPGWTPPPPVTPTVVVRGGWRLTSISLQYGSEHEKYNTNWGSLVGGNVEYNAAAEIAGIRGKYYGPCGSPDNHFYIIAGVSLQLKPTGGVTQWIGGDRWGSAGSDAAKVSSCPLQPTDFLYTNIGNGWRFEVVNGVIGRFIPAPEWIPPPSAPSAPSATPIVVVRGGWRLTSISLQYGPQHEKYNTHWGSLVGGNVEYNATAEITGIRGKHYGPCGGNNHFYIIAGVSLQLKPEGSAPQWIGGDRWGSAGSDAAKVSSCPLQPTDFLHTNIGSGWRFEVVNGVIGRFIPAPEWIPPPSAGSSGGLAGGSIAAIVLGVLLCIALVSIIALVVYFTSRTLAAVTTNKPAGSSSAPFPTSNDSSFNNNHQQQQRHRQLKKQNKQLQRQCQQLQQDLVDERKRHHVPYGPAQSSERLEFEFEV